jgi:predicted nicotinamide N-methyase
MTNIPDHMKEHPLKKNIHWETFDIKGKKFEILRITDTDKLLDTVSEVDFNMDERLPYWAELWPSSVALSEYIIENKKEFAAKRILEIGCGLGLAGIVATSCNAKVLFTDYDQDALEFAQINYQRNFKRAATVQVMDWRNPNLDFQFDVVMGTDVLYEKRWLNPILNVINSLVKKDGCAYLAEPNRDVAMDFFKMIGKINWQDKTTLKQVSLNNKLYSSTIHRITKC